MGKEKLNFSETVFYYICIIIDVSNENIFTFASSGYSTLTFFSSYVLARLSEIYEHRSLEKNNNVRIKNWKMNVIKANYIRLIEAERLYILIGQNSFSNV